MILNPTFTAVALPLDIVWADREANLRALGDALDRIPAGVDLVVLPELFTTGFINDPALLTSLPETNNGETMEAVRRLAARHNCALAGSFLAKTAHQVFNRGFFIEPSGDETFYDKRHLFSLSSEAKVYTPGTRPMPVVRFRGWNIAMIVCYDLRFPVWCRNKEQEYDALIVPANWASARGYAWRQLLIARAIENQAYVVGANRGGSDDYGDYSGMTYIFDSMGQPVGQPLTGTDGAVIATFSRENIDEWRRRFPAAKDADRFDLPLEI